MSWQSLILKWFTNDVIVKFDSELITVSNSEKTIQLKPLIVVNRAKKILAVGKEVPTSEWSQRVDFLTDASLTEKERCEFLEAFFRYAFSQLNLQSLLRPSVTVQNEEALSFFAKPRLVVVQALQHTGARQVVFET